MTTSRIKKCIQDLLAVSAVGAAVLTISGCGGGSGSSDTSPPTVRPKSLDELVLYLDGSVTFQFLRAAGTPPALKSGQVETGTFIYTRGGNELRQFPNTGATTSDTRFPDALNNAGYSYLAVNDTSASLTMMGTVDADLTINGGTYDAANGSNVYLFQNGSGSASRLVQVDLQFGTNGQVISLQTSQVSIPGSPLLHVFDTIIVPTDISTNTGGEVVENYNPEVDPNEPSKIVPASLNGRVARFTNGTSPALNFNIQFSSQFTFPNKSNPTDPDETGQGIITINGTPLLGALDYTWRRINGTDTAVLEISEINLPDPITLNGSYLLNFTSISNGTYAGSLDADTVDINDVTGMFFIPATFAP